MTLNPGRMTITVTDSEGMTHIFTDARGLDVLSQDMDDWLSYMAYKEFARGDHFSESIRDEITDTVARGRSRHE